jgi:puromycin-sensitive aminopeptidase
MPERRPFVRLPTDVYPVNYGLCLKPDLIDFTFEGKLEAIVKVGEVIERICIVL